MAMDENVKKNIQLHVAGIKPFEGDDLQKHDYDQDGQISVKDATAYEKQQNPELYSTATQKVDNDIAKENAPAQTTPSAPATTPADTTTTTQSSQVDSAMQKLNSELATPYVSKWQGQIDSTMSALENKKPFSYDLNGDILYQQYAEQFGQNAEKAMKDTVGQVSALSGGYGNSYAQTAGQQAYADTMSGLNDVIPELYQLALSKYNQEQQDLKDMLSIYQGMDESDYGRYVDDRDYKYKVDRDAKDDAWRQKEFDEGVRQFNEGHDLDEREFAEKTRQFGITQDLEERKFEEDVREFDITTEEGRRQFNESHDLDEREFAEKTRQFGETMKLEWMTFEQQVEEFNKTFSQNEKKALCDLWINKAALGLETTTAEDLAMGYTPEQAKKAWQKVQEQSASSVSTGGGSGYSGYSGNGGKTSYTSTQIKTMFNDGDYDSVMNALGSMGGDIYENAAKYGISRYELDYINEDGKLTSQEQVDYLLKNYKKKGTPDTVSAWNVYTEDEFYAFANLHSKYNTYADYLTANFKDYIDWDV